MADYEFAGQTRVVVAAIQKQGCDRGYNVYQSVTLGSSGGPDGGPFTYLWEASPSPSGPWATVSTLSGNWFYPRAPNTGVEYLRLTITNSSGFTTSGTRVLSYCEMDYPLEPARYRPSTAKADYEAKVSISSHVIEATLHLTDFHLTKTSTLPEPQVKYSWSVSDALGRTVIKTESTALGEVGLIPTTGLSPGQYFLTARSDGGDILHHQPLLALSQ